MSKVSKGPIKCRSAESTFAELVQSDANVLSTWPLLVGGGHCEKPDIINAAKLRARACARERERERLRARARDDDGDDDGVVVRQCLRDSPQLQQ